MLVTVWAVSACQGDELTVEECRVLASEFHGRYFEADLLADLDATLFGRPDRGDSPDLGLTDQEVLGARRTMIEARRRVQEAIDAEYESCLSEGRQRYEDYQLRELR